MVQLILSLILMYLVVGTGTWWSLKQREGRRAANDEANDRRTFKGSLKEAAT